MIKLTQRGRKELKETHSKLQKVLFESESLLEKSHSKYQVASEEWERTLILKENGQVLEPSLKPKSLTKSISINLFNKANNQANPKQINPSKTLKNEEEARQKLVNANEGYKTQLTRTLHIREQYNSIQLPELITVFNII